jgi:ABC-type transporter Mla subunit MlaD
MISTDITGNSSGGDAGQVFNLLAVVANPEVYGEKLKALVAATEESKKYIALVAPAKEILDLREQIEIDRKAISKELEDAKQAALQTKAKAKSDADGKVAAAETEAARLVADAQKKNADAAASLAEAAKTSNDADTALAAIAKQKAELAAEIAAGEKQRLLYEQGLKDVAATKAALIETHKRHILELQS